MILGAIFGLPLLSPFHFLEASSLKHNKIDDQVIHVARNQGRYIYQCRAGKFFVKTERRFILF